MKFNKRILCAGLSMHVHCWITRTMRIGVPILMMKEVPLTDAISISQLCPIAGVISSLSNLIWLEAPAYWAGQHVWEDHRIFGLIVVLDTRSLPCYWAHRARRDCYTQTCKMDCGMGLLMLCCSCRHWRLLTRIVQLTLCNMVWNHTSRTCEWLYRIIFHMQYKPNLSMNINFDLENGNHVGLIWELLSDEVCNFQIPFKKEKLCGS